jgi:hypothetical protein
MAQDTTQLTIKSTNGFILQTSVLKSAIRVTKQALFSPQPIINRSSPILTYSSSSSITVDINLDLKAVVGDLTAADMNNIAKGLMSLTFPVSSGVNGPPSCTLTVGKNTLLQGFQCVCNSASVNLYEENMVDVNGDPVSLSAALQFTGYEVEAQNASDFAGNSLQAYKNLTFN